MLALYIDANYYLGNPLTGSSLLQSQNLVQIMEIQENAKFKSVSPIRTEFQRTAASPLKTVRDSTSTISSTKRALNTQTNANKKSGTMHARKGREEPKMSQQDKIETQIAPRDRQEIKIIEDMAEDIKGEQFVILQEKVDGLSRMIESINEEKSLLERQNRELHDQIQAMKEELESLKKEKATLSPVTERDKPQNDMRVVHLLFTTVSEFSKI